MNGVDSSILENQLKTDDFLSIINKHDIFALVETHATYETEMNISKFKHFIKCRNRSENRSSRGNQKLAKGATYIPSENKNIIWCKLDKTYFNFQKDIYLYGASQRERGGRGERRENAVFFLPSPSLFPLSPLHLPKGLLFLLSPIFLCHKIKDGGCNNTKMNKL